jgi:hypothetical protein
LDHCIAREEFVMIGKNCQSLTEVSFQNLRGNAWAVRDFFRFCSPMLKSIIADYSLGSANFITIGSRCPQLQILRAPEGVVNDAALTALGAGCPGLKALDWNMRDFVTDAGVAAVARNGALTDVDIKMCSNLTDLALRTVAECCSHLKRVDIRNCHLLTDTTLISIGRHCPNLRSLCMDETNMTRAGIESIAAGCPLLEKLCAANCASIGPGLVALARGCPRLSKLMVSSVGVPAEAVRALAEGCPLLRELYLHRSREVGDEEITALVRGCPKLERLDISGTAVTKEGVQVIRDCCGSLKAISVGWKMLHAGREIFAGKLVVQAIYGVD